MSKPKRWVRARVEEDSGGSTQTPKVDIISDLPDPLLCYILSFLRTRTAVATSVLSRRWRHVWEYLLVFDFRYRSFLENLSGPRFPAFVGDVLGRRKVRHIHKFRLESSLTDHDATADWICSAVGPQLLELHLDLDLHFLDVKFPLPDSVFTCSALVSLTLLGRVTCRRPLPSVRFTSLRSLVMDVASDDPIEELLSGCPVLETLALHFYGGSNSVSIHVPPPLKRFTVRGNLIEDIEIDTPKSLEYLCISLARCSRISYSNLHNVVEAHVDVGDLDPCKLLRALCKAKVLVLKLSTTEYPLPEFPKFCGLLHLELFIKCDVDWSFVMDLLHKCPMLQFFKIFKTRLLETVESGNWTQPSIVPKCVVSELTTFEFGPYEGLTDEHTVIAYILQSGLVLKTVRIDTAASLSRRKRRRILKKLSVIPRVSNMCQLKLD